MKIMQGYEQDTAEFSIKIACVNWQLGANMHGMLWGVLFDFVGSIMTVRQLNYHEKKS